MLAAHTATEERLLHVHLPPSSRGTRPPSTAAMDDWWQRLTELNDVDPAFELLLSALLEAVREHVQEEETELFPRLPQSVRVTE